MTETADTTDGISIEVGIATIIYTQLLLLLAIFAFATALFVNLDEPVAVVVFGATGIVTGAAVLWAAYQFHD